MYALSCNQSQRRNFIQLLVQELTKSHPHFLFHSHVLNQLKWKTIDDLYFCLFELNRFISTVGVDLIDRLELLLSAESAEWAEMDDKKSKSTCAPSSDLTASKVLAVVVATRLHLISSFSLNEMFDVRSC